MISLREYARRVGVSHTAVQKAINTGRLSACLGKDKQGNVKIADPELADREWAANTDQSSPTNRITGEPKRRKETATAPYEPRQAAVPPPKGTEDHGGAMPDKGPSYAKSRAIREAYMARLAKLEFDQKAGKVINADEARVAVFNIGRRARDMLLAVPDRVAPLVVGQDDAHEIHRLLMDEMRRVCVELGKMKLPEAGGE
jgi:hypothetical protein